MKRQCSVHIGLASSPWKVVFSTIGFSLAALFGFRLNLSACPWHHKHEKDRSGFPARDSTVEECSPPPCPVMDQGATLCLACGHTWELTWLPSFSASPRLSLEWLCRLPLVPRRVSSAETLYSRTFLHRTASICLLCHYCVCSHLQPLLCPGALAALLILSWVSLTRQSRGSTPSPPPDNSFAKEAHLQCRHRRFPGDKSSCCSWTWTAEELTLEAGFPFSLVSWLIHFLGYPRCCRTVCTGVLPLAVCSGGSQVV